MGAAVGALFTAAGAGVSAFSSFQQGKSEKAINDYNAQVQEQQAKQAQADARAASSAQRGENTRLLSKQRALYAKAGVVASGTPLLVMAEQAGIMEMNALDIERQGKVKAQYLTSQASLDRMKGKVAKKAAYLQGYSTILNGVGTLFRQLDAANKGGGGGE